MYDMAAEVISIAEACLGGLRGRSALLLGAEEQLSLYTMLLQRAGMKYIYQEETPLPVPYLLPSVQLLISMPTRPAGHTQPSLTAAAIAKGCEGRHTPLVILDLASEPSVEEMAGLLPAVCLYTPADLTQILAKIEAKAS